MGCANFGGRCDLGLIFGSAYACNWLNLSSCGLISVGVEMSEVPSSAWGKPATDTHPPVGKRRIRCKLETVSDIKDEACRLYRAVRAGDVDSSEAGKLAYLLPVISKLAETADLERRLAELEQQ